VAEPDPGPGLYEVLGVPATATPAEVARAYRRRLREVHPDTAGSAHDRSGTPVSDELRALQDAYFVLRDPARRARYDAERAARPATPRADPTSDQVSIHVHTRPSRIREPMFRAGPVRVEPLPPRRRRGSRLWPP
jgi:curved DNA-binding protein CbpA